MDLAYFPSEFGMCSPCYGLLLSKRSTVGKWQEGGWPLALAESNNPFGPLGYATAHNRVGNTFQMQLQPHKHLCLMWLHSVLKNQPMECLGMMIWPSEHGCKSPCPFFQRTLLPKC